MAAPDPQGVLEVQVVFDMRAVHGDLPLDPLQCAWAAAAGNDRFVLPMARAAVAFHPPVGPLGGLRAHAGAVDVKLGGTQPIVLMGRIAALTAGSGARSTLDRPAADDALAAAFRFLMDLRMRARLAAVDAGEAPSNLLRLSSLSAFEQRRLRDHLRTVTAAQKALAQRYPTM